MKVRVIIPTLNEEKTIEEVIDELKKKISLEDMIVYDGNSTDRTREIARELGVKIMRQGGSGKGNAIREVFEKIDADIYVFIDGDNTYPANRIDEIIEPVLKGEADMVVGSRMKKEKSSMSMLHRFGNFVIVTALNRIFGSNLKDALSGYRALNRKVAKNIYIIADGFEVETELTIKTLMNRYRIAEIPMEYKKRPEGSKQKLKTFEHGYLIMYALFLLFRDYRPLYFFSILSIMFIIPSLFFGLVVVWEYLTTGLIHRIPLTILSTFLFLFGVQLFMLGMILDSVNRRMKETIHKSMVGKNEV